MQQVGGGVQVYGLRLGVRKSAFETLFAARLGILLMFGKRGFKALFVDPDALFRRELFCYLYGETECIVQAERRFAVYNVSFQSGNDLFKLP